MLARTAADVVPCRVRTVLVPILVHAHVRRVYSEHGSGDWRVNHGSLHYIFEAVLPFLQVRDLNVYVAHVHVHIIDVFCHSHSSLIFLEMKTTD